RARLRRAAPRSGPASDRPQAECRLRHGYGRARARITQAVGPRPLPARPHRGLGRPCPRAGGAWRLDPPARPLYGSSTTVVGDAMPDALIVIDMQRGGFVDAPPKHDAAGLIGRLNQLAAKVRAVGGAVVFVQHDGPAGDPFHPSQPSWRLLEELD